MRPATVAGRKSIHHKASPEAFLDGEAVPHSCIIITTHRIAPRQTNSFYPKARAFMPCTCQGPSTLSLPSLPLDPHICGQMAWKGGMWKMSVTAGMEQRKVTLPVSATYVQEQPAGLQWSRAGSPFTLI